MGFMEKYYVIVLLFFTIWFASSKALTLPSHELDLTSHELDLTSHELDLTSSSSSIHEGFTKSLSVTCSFTHRSGSDFSMVTSLILSRSQSTNTGYQEIATLTAVSGDHLVVQDSLGAQVTGRLTTDSDSFITFHWIYPSRDVEGSYKCKISGINKLGHCVTESATTVITQSSVDLEMLLAKVKAMEVIQDATTAELQMFKDRQNETREAFSQATKTFRGHQYFLSRPTPWNVPVADVMCRTLGGYLVEVNDDDEFQFVTGMLDDVNWTQFTLYGATDFGHQHQWTYLHSGEKAFLKWRPGQPDNNGNYDCLYSMKSYNWLMDDTLCVNANHQTVFVCEVE